MRRRKESDLLTAVIEIAGIIRAQRYADAMTLFLAGSIVREESTPYSDLDLVVVYDKLPAAFRESFHFQGYPVEAFVHDPETLHYFFMEMDRPSGMPSLMQMVVEGIEVPDTTSAAMRLKQLAESVLALGPPALTEQERDARRYNITNLVDDLRAARTTAELCGTGAELFEALADYHLRARGCWSGRNKSIPRALHRADPDLCARYSVSFDQLFTRSDVGAVIALAEDLLRPDGGFLFDGFRSDAPSASRRPLPPAPAD